MVLDMWTLFPVRKPLLPLSSLPPSSGPPSALPPPSFPPFLLFLSPSFSHSLLPSLPIFTKGLILNLKKLCKDGCLLPCQGCRCFSKVSPDPVF